MTTIKINEKANERMNFDARAEFKMIDETTAAVGNFAIIKFDYDVEDIDQVKTEQEIAAETCERYTNIELMQALALMDFKQEDDLDELPKYITELEDAQRLGAPMDFYPFVKNENELRRYLEDEFITAEAEEIDKYIYDFGEQYVYSPLGALFLNL